MLDKNGYRPNIGIIIYNANKQLFLARRSKKPQNWQFPQGGILPKESPQEGLFRELEEETGLLPEHVKIISEYPEWLTYDVPSKYVSALSKFKGQTQKWFLIELISEDSHINILQNNNEFDQWKWVYYWHPLEIIVPFKQPIYQKVLTYFSSVVNASPSS